MTASTDMTFGSREREQCDGCCMRPWRTLLIAILVGGVHLLAGEAPAALVYDRTGLGEAEIWRLITAHFVHCDRGHLGWNLAAFLVIGTRLEQRIGCLLWPALGTGSLTIGVWLWFARPDLQLYCGLSGILNTLVLILLAMMWREGASALLGLIALACVGKVALESICGCSLFTDTRWASVPGAHGAGLAAGVIFLIWLKSQPPGRGVRDSNSMGGKPFRVGA